MSYCFDFISNKLSHFKWAWPGMPGLQIDCHILGVCGPACLGMQVCWNIKNVSISVLVLEHWHWFLACKESSMRAVNQSDSQPASQSISQSVIQSISVHLVRGSIHVLLVNITVMKIIHRKKMHVSKSNIFSNFFHGKN